jgi:GT2 family glycosyltransferase
MSGGAASGPTESEDRDAPSVGAVVLSQGTRPADLRSSLQSILDQTGVHVDVVCVGNGWQPADLPEGIRALALDRNVGIPAGRNAGVPATVGDYLLFLDDDERLASERFVADAIELMRRHPDVGMVQPRIVDPTGQVAPRRWVPRLRKGSPEQSGNVFSVLEGAIVMPRAVFEQAGGWAAPFFYAHEGIELAWRVWDQGLRVWYAGDLVAEHPAVETTRHAEYYRMNARNRVWLARRNLPALFIPLYVGTWTGVQVLRGIRSPRNLRAWFAGWREGWRTDPGERRPIRWRTVWRMTRHGRPPII